MSSTPRPNRFVAGRFRTSVLLAVFLALAALVLASWNSRSRSSAAFAQGGGGPPGGHTHNFETFPPIPTPYVTVLPGNMVRAGDIVEVIDSYGEADHCLNSFCPFPGGYVQMIPTFVVEWTDGEAGGVFGKMVNGVFTTPCPPAEITHYKTPDDPKVVCIKVKLDDVLEVWDPYAGQWITTADDAQQTSACRNITVWDFTIEGPDANWRPMAHPNANSTTLSLLVRPETDHNGQSLAGTIGLTLVATSENEGICANAPNPFPQYPKDLILKWGQQPDWNVFDQFQQQEALGTGPRTTTSIIVESLDYGGWSKPEAVLTSGPLNGSKARDKRGPAGAARRLFCNVPFDNDGDHIADGMDGSQEENGFNGASRDNEIIYAGNPNRGDGFSDYEEYRGFILGGTWQETNRTVACVFVREQSGFGTGNFSESGLCIHLTGDADSNGAGVMNWASPPETKLVNQKRILLIKDEVTQGILFGQAIPMPGEAIPNVPSKINYAVLYMFRINQWVSENFAPNDQDAARTKMIRLVITHELD